MSSQSTVWGRFSFAVDCASSPFSKKKGRHRDGGAGRAIEMILTDPDARGCPLPLRASSRRWAVHDFGLQCIAGSSTSRAGCFQLRHTSSRWSSNALAQLDCHVAPLLYLSLSLRHASSHASRCRGGMPCREVLPYQSETLSGPCANIQ